MALLTDQFRIFTAEKFIKSLEGPDKNQSDIAAGANRDRLYVFIGRPQEWDNENNPPTPVDSFQEFSDAYDDMISMKRVLANDAVQVILVLTGYPQNKLLVVWVMCTICIVTITHLVRLHLLVLLNYMTQISTL